MLSALVVTRKARDTVAIAGSLMLALAACSSSGPSRTRSDTPATSSSPPAAVAGSVPIWFVTVRMVSPRIGWAVAWMSNPNHGRPSLALVRTSDGARNWSIVTPPGASPLLGPHGSSALVFAMDAQRAWFAATVVRPYQAPVSKVFATADAGRSWSSSRRLRTSGTPMRMDFVDPAHGWILTDEGATFGREPVAVLRTGDSGRTWTQVAESPGPIPAGCTKNGIAFDTSRTGWITGTCQAGPPFVYRTTDRGRTWRRVQLPKVPQSCRTQACRSTPAQFYGSRGFFSVDPGSRAELYSTSDGGVTWSSGPLPSRRRFAEMEFVNARFGYLVPEPLQRHDILYATSDSGATWKPVHANLGPTRTGEVLSFVTPSVGFEWVIGIDVPTALPTMASTTDGGRTWHRFIPKMTLPS
jgi:photosystem II stability/assembly factor-like uncharacterized protein